MEQAFVRKQPPLLLHKHETVGVRSGQNRPKAEGRQHIVFNGKFLSATPVGVHRVAAELIAATGRLIEERHVACRDMSAELLVPADVQVETDRFCMPVRAVGRLRGIAWEQASFALSARGALAINLINTGPVFYRNAVTMMHDAQVFSSPASYSTAFRSWYRVVQPLCGRLHRKILTVSDYSKVQLSAFGVAPAGKIAVIRNGVDHMLSIIPDEAIVPKLGLRPRAYCVGLANTQRHKNIGLLFEAFAHPSMEALRLVLVGAKTRADFEALGHDVPNNVLFAGRVSDEELAGLYSDALALAFPSLTEGFGLPPLEAMTLGCPAILAPCGALAEVCGDAAIYANPHSAEAWVGAIRSLEGCGGRWRELVAAGQMQAAKFTWRNAAISLMQLIQQL